MKLSLDIQLFAVPARKVSKTRKNKRKTHLKKEAPTFIKCKNCGEVVAPHRACTACGYYKGKEVIKQEKDGFEEEKEETKPKKEKKVAKKEEK